MNLRCAVIDDEYLARQYLIDYIRRIPFLSLAGEYNSPLLALEDIKNNKIDVIFLDIQMPDISGLEFLKTLNPQPFIIFTTAYKEFAIEGYEHNVVDYLLKPISFDRFLKAVNKIMNKAGISTPPLPAEKDNSIVHESNGCGDYIVIKADRKLLRINLNDLIYIEGQKAYATFHLRDRRITALTTLSNLENSLPHDKFIRIHKSFIVSVSHIIALQGNQVETATIKLPIGTSYKDNVNKLFGLK
jgi:DNA-binding LytR/AlgR family response regulator